MNLHVALAAAPLAAGLIPARLAGIDLGWWRDALERIAPEVLTFDTIAAAVILFVCLRGVLRWLFPRPAGR
ncbi:hypothetical protein EKE94_05645 [Mesobaculum littorinae]|uniref:Uncharacterized protein n=1 Tax=Mesobaculum littorinae TaxID=2486419 RepID=A0A438AIC8_9RHOB|nr:hypothetical protein [Mesobaculum littorinae]RVV98404.1 hypothetical protein EKE94_05645 [Mesobaculum littorinae]